MLLTDATKNAVLDALGALIDRVSLHDGFPGITGANEIAGGAPAYARQPITWNPAAAGSLDNNANPVFDVPGGGTWIRWLGLWLNAGSVYRGCIPIGAGALHSFVADDATDALNSDNHGFSDGDTLVVWGGSLPTGLAEGTIYYARDVATDSLKLALTDGGAAIDLTTDGFGFLQSAVPELFMAQGQFTVTDLDIDLSAVT